MSISIHAPHAGSDSGLIPFMWTKSNFNPRSPCGERRPESRPCSCLFPFQSTLPMRGATTFDTADTFEDRNFNPRSPCGERRISPLGKLKPGYFNPRSPCGERPPLSLQAVALGTFQSTLPMRGATSLEQISHRDCPDFNPRSPCGERRLCRRKHYRLGNFNPRSPCGERPAPSATSAPLNQFQSTLPMRGATLSLLSIKCGQMISIHAPHAGSDCFPWLSVFRPGFQSTLPMRGATPTSDVTFVFNRFQSTLPMRGATLVISHHIGEDEISIHAPHAGSD